MTEEGARTTLRSYLADTGVPPEKFLEALDILKGEVRALLEDVRPAPAAIPARDDPGESENIRRILEDIKARWALQDREKIRAASPAPPPSPKPPEPEARPSAPLESGRITMETVILKAPGVGRSQPRPPGPPAETHPATPAAREEQPAPFPRGEIPVPAAPPPAADDQPTMFIRTGTSLPPVPPPSAPPKEDGGEMILETMVRTSGKRPPNAPVAERKEPAAPPASADDQPTAFIRVGSLPPQEPPKPPARPPDDDGMDQTVIFRPDPLRGKGKGGPK